MRTAHLLCLVALAACRSRAPDATAPRRAAVALPRVAAAAAPPAPPPLSRLASVADRAILVVHPAGEGAARVEIGAGPDVTPPQRPVSDLLRHTPDGWMTVSLDRGAPTAIHRFQGSQRTELALPAEHQPRGLDVALRDGAVLSAHREGGRVMRVGAQPGVYSAASPSTLRDLTATADGAVWAIADNALHRRVNDRWEPVAALAGSTWERFVTNADEPVLLVGPRRILRYAGSAWRELPIGPDGPGAGNFVAVGPDGAVVFALPGGLRIAAVSPAGARVTFDLNDHAIPPGAFRGLARDGRGRTWAATTSGLAVLAADGSLLRWYAPGTMRNALDQAGAVLVTGNGPAVLPAAPPVHRRVRGRILANGEPVAGARVELCEEPLQQLGTGYTSPCDPLGREETLHPAYALTRADGRFEFVDVATGEGSLWLAVRPPGHRWVYPGAPSVNPEEVGEASVDLGAVTVRLPR